MIVTVHRAGSGQGALKKRAETIGDEAGHLVASHLGGRLPSVRIVITDAAGMARQLQEADTQLAGGINRYNRTIGALAGRRDAHRAAGVTALTPTGALVLINARHNRAPRELDRTLLHELAHAVQLTQRGARQQHIAYLRQQFRLDPLSKTDERDYERLMDIREQQAVNLEALHRQLAP